MHLSHSGIRTDTQTLMVVLMFEELTCNAGGSCPFAGVSHVIAIKLIRKMFHYSLSGSIWV
jgi:hypothetical protein